MGVMVSGWGGGPVVVFLPASDREGVAGGRGGEKAS